MKCILILFWTMLGTSVYAQVSKVEDDFIADFPLFMKDIRKKIQSDGQLTKKQAEILGKVKDSISTFVSSFDIYSNSDSRTIIFNKTAWAAIFRYFASREISKSLVDRDLDTQFNSDGTEVDYNRKSYFGFYNYVLKWLSPDIDVEQQAEFNERQKKDFEQQILTEFVKFEVKKTLAFIYLHEFYHQIQNVNKEKDKIDRSGYSKQMKDSLYLDLEYQCDSFALYKSKYLRILPEGFFTIYDIVNSFKQTHLPVQIEVSKRRLVYFQMLLRAAPYFNEPYLLHYSFSSISKSILYLEKEIAKEEDTSGASVRILRQEAIAENNIDKYYSLGYFYLVGNSVLDLKNIDSSLYYFETAAGVDVGKDSLKLRTKERALLCAGKIYELVKNNKPKAILLFNKAREIKLFFPKEYYDNLITRLSAASVGLPTSAPDSHAEQ